MTKRKSISVWLTLKDGKNKGKIVLQKRSLKNKVFSFICQASWAGKVEEKEKINETIKRECEEELGKKFCSNFNFSELALISRSGYITRGEERESYNYLGKISKKLLNTVKIHREAFPNFIFVNNENAIYPIKSKKDPKNNIVLFDDQYKILKKILNGIKGNTK